MCCSKQRVHPTWLELVVRGQVGWTTWLGQDMIFTSDEDVHQDTTAIILEGMTVEHSRTRGHGVYKL